MRTIRLIMFTILGTGALGSILAQPQHFQFTSNTGTNATVGVPLTVNPNISGSPLVSGDEIGAFTSAGLCVGAVVWDGTLNVSLTVWGDDDQTTEVDGIAAGDTIRYRVWRQSTDTEYGSVAVTYTTGDGVYQTNSLHTLGSLTATAPPDAPTLASPTNGVTDQPTTLTLTWNTAARSESYRVQVSTDSSFTSPVVDSSTTDTSHQVSSLLNHTTYFWRVSATNSGGTSDWSTVRSFTTTLAAPVLASPSDGSTNLPTTLTLSWNDVTGTDNYRVQVSTESSFTSLVVDDSTVATPSREVTSLLNNATYFWRVRATNSGSTSDWSEVWTFTTTLAAPVLASPSDGSVDQPTTLTLSWNATTGADSYRIQVSSQSSFTSPVVDDSTVTTLSREVTSLFDSTTYFWRVNAKNTGGTSEWSEVWTFTTVPPPPDIPVLASPADSSTLQPTTLTLSWGATSGADNYYVQVSPESSFTSFVVDDSTTTTSYEVTSLANATTYYWRVQSQNPGGLSDWSTVWRFTTIGTPMTHGVTLVQGWNMISSFVSPGNPNLDTLTADIQSNLVIIKNGQGEVYWPAIPTNSIGDWNFIDGYQVYMTAPDTLMIAGNEVMPEMNPLSLAQGWHLLSYMRNDNLAIDSALSSIAGDLVIVKNNDGQVYWPALGVNQIGDMKAGQGYQLYLSAASTLTYPANSQSSPGDVITSRLYATRSKQSDVQMTSTAYFTFRSNTGNNATIGLPASSTFSVNGTQLAAGDEIGVFTPSGLCVGGAVWKGSGTAITVWGDDSQTSEIDGIQTEELIHYRVWRKSGNQEIRNVPVTYSEGSGSYSPNGMSVLSTLGSASTTGVNESGLPGEFALAQNYPNPFNPTTTIRYELPHDAQVSLRLFDLLGREIAVLVDRHEQAGYHSVQFNAKGLPSGVYVYRLEAGRFNELRRMILVR